MKASSPGIIDVNTGTIGEDIQNIPEFRRLALGRTLMQRTGLPVVVGNDVNALTLGEWCFGQAQGLRHVAMIAVGTSIGGGLILNGALVRGAGGYGGEIGHITVDLDGPECLCGSRGCIKVYASGPDLARQARSQLGTNQGSVLLDLARGDPDRIDAPLLMEPVVRWARFYAFEVAFDRTRIVRSSLTKESGALGAAALFLYEQSHGRLD